MFVLFLFDSFANYVINTTQHNTTVSLALILLLFCFSSLAQTDGQVLTRVNGGAKWENAAMNSDVAIRAVRTSSMTIPSSTMTTSTYDREDYDISNSFDHSTGIFTPPSAGYFVIMATVDWDNFNSNTATRTIRLTKNGNNTVLLQHSESGSNLMSSSLHTVVYSDGNDNFRIRAWQNSGADHETSGNTVTPKCVFSAFRIR